MLDNDTEWLIEEPNEAGLILHEGDTAYIAWRREDSVLVADT